LGNQKSKTENRRISGSGYDVQIKRRGRFTPLGISTTKEEATALGIREVLGGSSATFRLAPTEKAATTRGLKLDPRLLGLFRPGKKAGEQVQKKTMRILSFGEKESISQKGIESRRGKSKIKTGRKIKFI
jgi:hypothetical protein